MPITEIKIQVHCPISKRPEYVYVRTLDYNNIHLEEFNGCESGFHSCHACNIVCKEKAIAEFQRLRGE